MSAATSYRNANGANVDTTKLHVDVDGLSVTNGTKAREDAPLLTASSSSSTLYTVSRASSPESPSSPSEGVKKRVRTASPRKQFEFPWGKVIVILVLNAVQPFAFELVFPFINQMILEIGVVDDPERVGFYSGIIESIFSFMSFLFVIPCSYISDTYGRKPVVLMSIGIMAVAMSAFGFSETYMFMIVTRSIGGVVGASWTTMKVMLGELTDRSTQGRAFAMFGIAYRIGQILGQPVGGLLSHPERNFPFLDTPLWRAYPYAFPCVFSGSIALLAVFAGCFILTETRPRKVRERRSRQATSESTLANDDMMFAKIRRSPWLSALTPYVISVLSSLATMVASSEMLFALYPLFAFTPIAYGGLGLSEAAIGTHMAVRSAISIIIMLVYAPVQERVGPLRIYQWSTSTWPLAVLCMPALSLLASSPSSSPLTMNLALGVFFTIWGLANLSWPASAVIINDAAPTADALGAVNGLSQMVIVLSEAVAPALGTALFAYSKSSDVLAGNLIWVVLFAVSCGTAMHCWTLKEASHDWRKDYEDEMAEEE